MNKGAKLAVALTMITAKATGGAFGGSFIGDDLASVVHRCAYYTELERDDLQIVLEELLANRPDDDCIPFIVDLLGGAPIAQIVENNSEDPFRGIEELPEVLSTDSEVPY